MTERRARIVAVLGATTLFCETTAALIDAMSQDKQEEMIAASDLDRTIVRRAPFSEGPLRGDLEVHTRIAPETRVTRDEVAEFVMAQLDTEHYLRQCPFIGHA